MRYVYAKRLRCRALSPITRYVVPRYACNIIIIILPKSIDIIDERVGHVMIIIVITVGTTRAPRGRAAGLRGDSAGEISPRAFFSEKLIMNNGQAAKARAYSIIFSFTPSRETYRARSDCGRRVAARYPYSIYSRSAEGCGRGAFPRHAAASTRATRVEYIAI